MFRMTRIAHWCRFLGVFSMLVYSHEKIYWKELTTRLLVPAHNKTEERGSKKARFARRENTCGSAPPVCGVVLTKRFSCSQVANIRVRSRACENDELRPGDPPQLELTDRTASLSKPQRLVQKQCGARCTAC